MRRKDRQTDETFAWRVVDGCAYAVLSCADSRIMPYATPLSIARQGNHVYFHCATEGKRTAILRENPAVCIVCVGNVAPTPNAFSTEYESAILFGNAQEITDEGEKLSALRYIATRYTPHYMEHFNAEVARSLHRTAVWKVTVTEITGKKRK